MSYLNELTPQLKEFIVKCATKPVPNIKIRVYEDDYFYLPEPLADIYIEILIEYDLIKTRKTIVFRYDIEYHHYKLYSYHPIYVSHDDIVFQSHDDMWDIRIPSNVLLPKIKNFMDSISERHSFSYIINLEEKK